RLGERVLAGAGYTVLTTADGIAALAVLAAYAGHVDLLITDMILPMMGGPELARRVAETHPEARILFTSGYPGDVLAGDGRLPAGAAFIGKPYTPEDLIAEVGEVLFRRE
ncbi:MAG: response regulator, partial [Chloroflexota bacterium]